jgi:hypothetical protein
LQQLQIGLHCTLVRLPHHPTPLIPFPPHLKQLQEVSLFYLKNIFILGFIVQALEVHKLYLRIQHFSQQSWVELKRFYNPEIIIHLIFYYTL